MKKIIVANWKMNPKTAKEAKKLFKSVSGFAKKSKKTEIILALPFVYLSLFGKNKIKLCGQDVFYKEQGAYTGEISPAMLKSLGVNYVIVGHSERRWKCDENDELINKKIKAGLKAGLKVILAIGEKQRDGSEFWKFLKNQIKNDLSDVPKKLAKNLIIAYEPVWTIGTKKPIYPKDLLETAIFIRRVLLDIFDRKTALGAKILYGGSVEPENAEKFLEVEGISGLLVGGASLDAEKFKQIIQLTFDA